MQKTHEAKYQYLINKPEDIWIKHLNDRKAFIENSNDTKDVYKNTEEYNPGKKHKVLTVFDDIIADTNRNIKLNSIVIN